MTYKQNKEKVNARAKRYRQRMKEKGYKHVAVWIKKEKIEEFKSLVSSIFKIPVEIDHNGNTTDRTISVIKYESIEGDK